MIHVLTEQPELPLWLTSVAMPLLIALLTSGVIVLALQRRWAAQDRRRDQYAEAVAAVVAWIEYPFRIRRRTSGAPTTLTELANIGHDLQERLARNEAWLATYDKDAKAGYTELVGEVKKRTRPLIQKAWAATPTTSGTSMNLNGWGVDVSQECHQLVKAYIDQTQGIWLKGWR